MLCISRERVGKEKLNVQSFIMSTPISCYVYIYKYNTGYRVGKFARCFIINDKQRLSK